MVDTTCPDLSASDGLRTALKVGFLFNHDELHQVAHTAPIISSLRRLYPSICVDVLTSSEAQTEAVMRHIDPSLERPAIHALQSSVIFDLAEALVRRAAPLGRIGNLKASLDLLSQYDALVVPETTSTLLKTRFGLQHTKLIFFPHGAGDRSISISPEITHFDFVMLPGEKTRARMLDARIVREEDSAVVGYPKFDSRTALADAPIFANDRPTVLYNPHFDPKLSSWFDFGLAMLEFFADQEDYNLIVAPHVMLFRRKLLASVEHRAMRIRHEIPERFFDFDHIHIDTGSLNSVDMTYTRLADIYVGDVSSQVYEFIAQPRPAIFLNSHADDWRGDANYAFWDFGQVVDNMRDFASALASALPMDEKFAARQSLAFEQTMDVRPDISSADRAATVIAGYLEREFPRRSGNV